jgi:hypothetical protein
VIDKVSEEPAELLTNGDGANPPPVDMGSDDGDKEDPDGIKKVQERGGDGESQGGDERSAAEGEGDDTAEDPGCYKSTTRLARLERLWLSGVRLAAS